MRSASARAGGSATRSTAASTTPASRDGPAPPTPTAAPRDSVPSARTGPVGYSDSAGKTSAAMDWSTSDQDSTESAAEEGPREVFFWTILTTAPSQTVELDTLCKRSALPPQE